MSYGTRLQWIIVKWYTYLMKVMFFALSAAEEFV